MMMHQQIVRPECGRYIVADEPWAGLGYLIGSAVSRLKEDQPSYVYMYNEFYRPGNHSQRGNKWDWLFDQKLLDIPYKISQGRNHIVMPCNSRLSTETVHRYRRIIKDQWKVKAEILAESSRYVPQGGCLGVHYRGTDKLAEVERPSLDMVAEKIKQCLARHGLGQVLLATDDNRALLGLRARLDRPVLWFEKHMRGNNDVGVHQQFGGYRQARETMVEIMAIGMCDHMLVGRSSVADSMLLLGKSDWTYYN